MNGAVYYRYTGGEGIKGYCPRSSPTAMFFPTVIPNPMTLNPEPLFLGLWLKRRRENPKKALVYGTHLGPDSGPSQGRGMFLGFVESIA